MNSVLDLSSRPDKKSSSFPELQFPLNANNPGMPGLFFRFLIFSRKFIGKGIDLGIAEVRTGTKNDPVS